jgi:UDP-glucose 4-epimerase
MKILITGGAGYIGSHVVKQLLETTIYEVTVLDNLSTGHTETIQTLQEIRNFKFVTLDLKEFSKVFELLDTMRFDVIMHFAASIVVSESVQNPLKYYVNNTTNTTNLIDCALKTKVQKFIFSSTAAVYGAPKIESSDARIDENYETKPINPYGMSKLMSEQVLQDATKTSNTMKYIIFRYFNVAGADMHFFKGMLSPRIGQQTPNATHLIKIATECALKKREQMYIFGDDYETKDGTGVRDYIHVEDLADAHIKAIKYLDTNKSDIFNLGYGTGYSVKEVLQTVQEVSKRKLIVHQSARRKGDPAILVANNQKIVSQMHWQPKYNSLALICHSAFAWEKL